MPEKSCKLEKLIDLEENALMVFFSHIKVLLHHGTVWV